MLFGVILHLPFPLVVLEECCDELIYDLVLVARGFRRMAALVVRVVEEEFREECLGQAFCLAHEEAPLHGVFLDVVVEPKFAVEKV